MKTAIITPTPLLEKYGNGGDDYHLILSHLVHESDTYATYYSSRSREGDWVILDNSAHEFGAGETSERLLRAIERTRPSEVVLPDRLFFGGDTVDDSREAASRILHDFPDLKLMGCPQGRTLSEWLECLFGLIKIGVYSIGISKDYETWRGGLPQLVSIVSKIVPNHPIHLLGWGRQWEDLRTLAKMPVRGIDSAKPLVYAYAGISLADVQSVPTYPRRPRNFFDLAELDHDITSNNVAFFRKWAGAAL